MKEQFKDIIYDVLNDCLLDLENNEDLTDKEYELLRNGANNLVLKIESKIEDTDFRVPRGKEYECIKDLQGGSFAVGRVGDLKYWREVAIDWASSDESLGLVRQLTRYEIKSKDLIDFIQEHWQIEIREV